jgi:hypothetical protein
MKVATDATGTARPRWTIERVIVCNGEPCPRCGQPTEKREHEMITPKMLRSPRKEATDG